MRDLIRKLTPQFFLNWYRSRKKQKRNAELNAAKEQGNILTKQELIDQLHSIGVNEGDSLLVHSSLSKIGYVEGGAQTVVEALLETVGKNGNLLMYFPKNPSPTTKSSKA